MTEPTAMFPLGSVLLPHMPLRLQLFERRYLMMLGQLLESDEPQFGAVLIERGREVGGGEQRMEHGTLARVVEVDPRVGITGLLAIGTNRIRVRRWLPDDPYPRAELEVIPELVWSEDLAGLFTETETAVRRLLGLAAELGAGQAHTIWPADITVSEEPVPACWQLAAVTPLGELDHYDLLRSETCEELLVRTKDLAVGAADTAALLLTDPPPGDRPPPHA